jgi:hypothetical protein
MNGNVIPTLCPSCSTLIPQSEINDDGTSDCSYCGKSVVFTRFPAFDGKFLDVPVIAFRNEGESACFFHSRYRAQVPCDECGRFLCSLCAVQFGAQTLCPECIHKSRRGPKATGLSHQALLYDNLALSLVTLPLNVFFFYFTIITAPAGLFVSFFYFGRQKTVVRRSRIRFIIAMILAVLEIAGVIFLIVWLIAYLKNNIPNH